MKKGLSEFELRTQLEQKGFSEREINHKLKTKKYDFDVVRFQELEEQRKQLQVETESLQSERKAKSKSIGQAKASGEDIQPLLDSVSTLGDDLDKAKHRLIEVQAALDSITHGMPNLPDETVPEGNSDEDNVEIRRWGDIPAFDFEPKDHVEIGKIIKAIDTERGAKVAGARSYYLTGVGALLELALVNHAIATAVKAGFIPMIPPVLVKPAAMEGTGFLGQAAENVYHLKEDELYLVGTSEVPLAAFHMDEILENLPIRYAGYSPCFRREAGSYGKDTRGIIRVHQFEKVEMFTFCKPEDAEAEHKKLLAWEKAFFDSLEIPYRVIDVASGDLGASAVRKFDIEAWIPTQDAYREVTSTSNCTQFQARRLNIRYKDEKGTKPVATLNGTLVAVPRTIVAILENHQQKDGSVKVPKALIPFLGMDTLVIA